METVANLIFIGLGAVIGFFSIRSWMQNRSLRNKLVVKEISLIKGEVLEKVNDTDIDDLIARDLARKDKRPRDS